MLFNAHNSYLYYDNYHEHYIHDYVLYIRDLIQRILTDNLDIHVNIIFARSHYNFDNNNPTLNIVVNYEHTLVKVGGRDSNGAKQGMIPSDANTNYLVRLVNMYMLNPSHIIIDYSIPNIVNVATSNMFPEITKKHIYISPSLYNNEVYNNKENRNINTLTTFINMNERREHLINELSRANIGHTNVNNCFEKESLYNLYKNTKIVINIHQTDHHHTFEELRVLPALQAGCVVVAELSPLSHLIPYHDYIIWVPFINIVEKVEDILKNYDFYYDSIYNSPKLLKLDMFDSINYDTLRSKIIQSIL
jgi:hypothetical protein